MIQPEQGDAANIARLMGLRRWQKMSDLALVEEIEQGLPLKAAETVGTLIARDNEAGKYAIVSRSTHARAKRNQRNHLTKGSSEKVYAAARVFYEAMRLWGNDKDATTRFLNRPHPLLGGRTPLNVATESTAGTDLVVQVIGEARAGVAV